MKKPGQLKISSTYFENLAENCKLKKKMINGVYENIYTS